MTKTIAQMIKEQHPKLGDQIKAIEKIAHYRTETELNVVYEFLDGSKIEMARAYRLNST